jgi:uncharacterized protein
MDHKARIEEELKDAMRKRETVTLSVLRMLLAAIKNKEVEKKGSLSEEEFFGIIKTSVKQHNESIESFKKGKRLDLAEKEEKELAILRGYLPAPLSEEELLREIDEAVQSLEAKNQRDMGKVVKYILGRFPGRVDGKILSQMVLKRLPPA